jgi:hypothetical protein
MPNWCNNAIEVSHPNPVMMVKFKKGLEKGLMNEFIPCPQELIDTVSGFVGDKQDELEAKQKANIEKYGYATWYEHNINEWGTKWDVDSIQYDEADGVVQASFDTAWAPPIQFYEHLESVGFEVKAMYYEPGMAFCGIYQDGCDDSYNLSDMDADEVVATIPNELDEAFAISEQMADWENQNEEDGE